MENRKLRKNDYFTSVNKIKLCYATMR